MTCRLTWFAHAAGLALFVAFAACSGDNHPDPDPSSTVPEDQAPLVTDTTAYVLDWDSRGWGVDIPYRFRNTAGDTLYAVNCNGALTIGVERERDGVWRPFWVPATNACLSPPIVMPPGAVRDSVVTVWGARPGGNIGPAFADTTFDGQYRLVWYNLVLHYDADRTGFGDSVPLRYRASNGFTLRATR